MIPDTPDSPNSIPDLQSWSVAAVKLLQGVVYDDDSRIWNEILTSRSKLESWLGRIGLVLVVDETGGFAYLRQLEEDDGIPDGYAGLPRLFRRTRLGYSTTLLCVLLRDELRRFEDEEVDSSRCVVEEEELLAQWRMFFPEASDEQKQRREFSANMKKIVEFGFAAKLDGVEPTTYEIRRILKARITVSLLEDLKEKLATAEK